MVSGGLSASELGALGVILGRDTESIFSDQVAVVNVAVFGASRKNSSRCTCIFR